MKKFISEFKEFALKGNIVDMAVGVIIGGAFGKIVSSLVADVITPLISLGTGNVSLVNLKHIFRAAEYNELGEIVKEEIALTYGNFIQTIIDFFIIALSIFVVLKLIMKAKDKFAKKEEEAAPTTKKCPFCCSEIDIAAAKCPHCTSELPKEE